MLTERECVERERKAFADGWAARGGVRHFGEVMANCLYPLPDPRRTVTRPRMVNDQETLFLCAWRVVDGELQYCFSEDPQWYPAADKTWRITPARARLWADLLENPTEEVEA